ncbi:DUF2971 domain-containing protein [Gelidibacter salicanalis]|uniref:DUF2971 domain-containing protein n=1 Tax=Gelidibacter salicanalis TaxID=291193 RepID=A0A934KNB4_9FLAO|nr:DUF2971 domain-containing protein [Gelidibacter salicanalis]MBJ7882501.1 DUF2971 domain-containing protein [Gelidibacter salicanalis]
MNDSEESTWIEQHFDLVRETFKDKEYEKYLTEALNTYEWNKHKPFIFCLSEKKDSLSQWRAYSADGKGVCIGFSTKALNIKQDSPWPNSNADHTIGILPIEYSIRNQKKEILKFSEDFKKIYDEKKEELWEVSSAFLGTSFATLAMTFKNPSFIEEKEWRIIHTPTKYSVESETEKRMSDLKFRVNNHKIVTYHEYDLSKIFNSKLINEIVLGPKSNIDIPELEQFLEYNNLSKTKISISESTYR